MRVWRKSKKKSEAKRDLNRRRCWQKCHNCKKVWSGIVTEYVHMIVWMEGKVSKSGFICDKCLVIMESSNQFSN